MATLTVMATDTITDTATSQDADFIIIGVDVVSPGDQLGTVGTPV